MCHHISQFTDLTHIVVDTSKTNWCAFVYFTVQNCMEYNSAGLYFKPTLSERKHKCSGNVNGTTILFLKVCRVAQLCLIFNIWIAVRQAPLAMGILQTRILEWVAMPYPGTARLKMFLLLFVVFMYYLHENYHKAIKLQ